MIEIDKSTFPTNPTNLDIILQRFVFKCYYFPTGNSICQPKQPSYSVCIITIFSITNLNVSNILNHCLVSILNYKWVEKVLARFSTF